MYSSGKPTTLVEFSEEIAKAACQISKWCSENGHPEPTLRPANGYKALPVLPESAPKDVRMAREALIDAAKRVHQVAMEPSHGLQDMAVSIQHLACLRWICVFKILDFVPEQGSISYDSLAHLAGVPEHSLKSVVRMLMCSDFLSEPIPGMVSHSRSSAKYASTPALQDYVLYLAEVRNPVAMKFTEATQKWGETANKTQTAFNIAFNTELSFFEFLTSDAAFRERSAGLMKFGASLPGAALHHLVEAFPWSELGHALVVDVGGNSGHASVALAKAYPHLEFIVQDLPSAIEHAMERERDLEPDVRSRVTFRVHDFFQKQPEKNADVYLVRRILHDWSDQEARAILANLRDAMKPGSRLLIMDTVLPEPQSGSLTQESIQRSSNLGMQQSFNSQERTLAEWSLLLTEVDARFRIVNVTTPFESTLSLLVVELTDSMPKVTS